MNSLIVTARLEDEAQSKLNLMRERFFPSERNYLDAHVTVLHDFPENERAALDAWLAAACTCAPLKASLQSMRAWRTGFAIHVECPALVALHCKLKEHFEGQLAPQDKAKLWPHATVQNKTPRDQSADDFLKAQAIFAPQESLFVALDVWRYDHGPWTYLGSHQFTE